LNIDATHAIFFMSLVVDRIEKYMLRFICEQHSQFSHNYSIFKVLKKF
jgi:hypothetical protein